MKTFLVILAIVALVALNEARPNGRRGRRPEASSGGLQGGSGGPGRGGPRGRKGPGGLMRRVCEVRFADGTTRSRDCFKADGLFDCQKIELSEFSRLPRRLANATEISLCLPIPCTFNSQCSFFDARSTCVEGLPKPDEATRAEIKLLKESCMPRRQRSNGDRTDDDDDDDDDDVDDADTFLAGRNMCSVPPSYFVTSRACRLVNTDGTNVRTKECRSRRNETVTLPCNATSACEVSYQGRNVKLHFCEKPARTENPQGGNNGNPQAPEPLTSNTGNGQPGNGQLGDVEQGEGDSETGGNRRGRGRGNRRGSGGNQRGGGNGPRGRRNRGGDGQNPEQNPDTDQNDDQP